MSSPTTTSKSNNASYDVSATQWNSVVNNIKNQFYNYLIYKSGSDYYAKNGLTGEITSSDNAATFIASLADDDTTILIAPGTYNIPASGGIGIDLGEVNNFKLIGSGYQTKLIGAAADEDVISLGGNAATTSNVTISDMYIECNGTDTTNQAVDCDNGTGITYERLWIKSTQDGVDVHGNNGSSASNIIVRDCYIEATISAIYLLADTTGLLQNSYIYNNILVGGQFGVRYQRAAVNTFIHDNLMTGQTSRAVSIIFSMQNAQIYKNTIDSCTATNYAALYMEPNESFTGCQVTDNNIISTVGHGIALKPAWDTTSDFTIRGNKITTCTGAGADYNASGIYVRWGQYGQVADNVITGCVAYGVLLHGPDRTNVFGNTLTGNDYGLNIAAADAGSTFVHGNILTGNISGTYTDTGTSTVFADNMTT